MASKGWIGRLKKGALHRQLGVAESEPIPAAKLRAARSGKYGKLAQKRAATAATLSKLRPAHTTRKK